MKLHISENRMIRELQDDFNRLYPYLKIDFYKSNAASTGYSGKKHLQNSISIKAAGVIKSGNLPLSDSMTVKELENIFSKEFGLYVQTSRKSGILWLETTITDKWTLKQQNDHGMELSEPVRYEPKL